VQLEDKPKFGKYQLLEQLGAGATAEVYRALDRTLEREVALKLLKPSLVGDTQAFERFLQEARGAARLFHPNIATMLEVGENGGCPSNMTSLLPETVFQYNILSDGLSR